MNASLFLYGEPVRSFKSLVSELSDGEFASPTRSTLPLIDFWRSPSERLASLWDTLGLSKAASVELRFEHATPVRAGAGKASFTDLMIVSPVGAIAVEAKWTEPPYATVAKWLTTTPTANRVRVLDGWLQTIGATVGATIDSRMVSSLPYQLIHRAASVCCIDAPVRWVVYQTFDDHNTDYYRKQLSAFSQFLPATGAIGLGVYSCALNPISAGAISTANALRADMQVSGLFNFQQPTMSIIRAPG